MNVYQLLKAWSNFARESSENKPIHAALFFTIVDLFNRLGWKEEIGLPSYEVMESMGVGNYRTYKKALEFLEEKKFIKIKSWAKNQFNSTRICFGKSAEALPEALPKAQEYALAKVPKHCPKHYPKHCPKHCHYNKTSKDYKTSKDEEDVKPVVDEIPNSDKITKKQNPESQEETAERLKYGRLLNFIEFRNELLEDEIWINTITQNLSKRKLAKPDKLEIPVLFENFALVQIGLMHSGWDTQKDFAKHFLSWCVKHLQSEKNHKSKSEQRAKNTTLPRIKGMINLKLPESN